MNEEEKRKILVDRRPPKDMNYALCEKAPDSLIEKKNKRKKMDTFSLMENSSVKSWHNVFLFVFF